MITDEIKEQQMKMNNMNTKEKLSYIIYYYKFHIIFGVIILSLIISFAYTLLSAKDTALNCVLLNTDTFDSTNEALRDDYAAYAGINQKDYEIIMDTGMKIDYEANDQLTYNYVAKLMAQFSAKTIDCMIATPEIVDNYAAADAYGDLENDLPKDLLAALNGKYEFYYAANSEGQKIAAGIYLTNSDILKASGLYKEQTNVIFTIAQFAPQKENAYQMLRYLIQ